MDCAVIAQPYNHVSITRRKTLWYTIASGNWTDKNIWMSNSRRKYAFPQTGDDVEVGLGHTVTCNANVSINNLYVAGSLIFDSTARTITVAGDMQATGTLNMSNAAHNLILNGVNNYAVNYTGGTSGTVIYNRLGDQNIMNVTHMNMTVQNAGNKYLQPSTTITGTTNVFTSAVLTQTDSSTTTFIGLLNVSAAGVNFSGNPSPEFRGGLTFNNLATFSSGTGNWNFTTNSQNTTFTSGTYQFNSNVNVVGTITVTNVASSGIMSVNAPVNCTVAGGSLINKGTIYFNSTSSLPSFTTGTFDRTSFANTVGYTMPANATLPYTNYYSLLVSNSGTKTSVGSTSLLGNLTVSNPVGIGGTYDLGAFNLTVNGTTATSSNAVLKKTGAGSVLFIGQVTNTISSTSLIDFSGGNPSVEVRGGVVLNFVANTWRTGTGTWTFTTNNQSISGYGQAWDSPIVVSGAITTTYSPSSNTGIMYVPSINGTVASSKFLISTAGGGAPSVYFTTTTLPMVTGIFDYTTFANTIGYAFNGDYTLPYTSYSGLFIGGTGTKTVPGNTVLGGGLIIDGNGFLELSTFDLTVNGSTAVAATAANIGTLSKTGGGSIIFVGALAITGIPTLNLTGNPSVELRGGMSIGSTSAATYNGSPTLSFTTNNQTITASSAGFIISYNILISGAITVTIPVGSAPTITGSVNGNNAASTFDNRGTVNYKNAQQPMLTGVLQTNLAANTFVYNAAANQDVTGGTYRTLTLAGSGVKTLTGNVVVATLYTLTPPATLNTNGFTRT